MNIVQQMEELTNVLVELIEKEKNYTQVKIFVLNCGDAEVQSEWDSLTEEERRAVADELYYHHFSA